MRLNRYFK